MDPAPVRADLQEALLVVGSLAYPLLVYFGLSVVPPLTLVCVALALIGLRLAAVWRRREGRPVALAMLAAGGMLAVLFALDPHLAVIAYPVLASLAVASAFGLSLLHPPSLIERIARLKRPVLSPREIAYARKVTVGWTVFLLGNAVISAVIGVSGSLGAWTLYNGLVSYLLMGALFLCELIVRSHLLRRVGAHP